MQVNTYSHLLYAWTYTRLKKCTGSIKKAILWGSIAPDIPLYALTLGAFIWFSLILDWSVSDTFTHIFGNLYFSNPVWMALHNLLHAPLMLVIIWLVLFRTKKRKVIAAFLLSCAFHTFVDILVHYDDGPLLLFPFNWSVRFFSPISYWDPAHYGFLVGTIEHIVSFVLLVGLIGYWIWKKYSVSGKKKSKKR
ncbi:MAG: hypothetical protein ACI8Y7_000909 [Candidatus Woesearchaeota archaeon]